MEFKRSVLADYVAPLLEHDNQIIGRLAHTTLASFPMEMIMPLLKSPTEFDFSSANSSLLARLLTHEIQQTGKAIFKGLSNSDGTSLMKKDDQDRLTRVKNDTIGYLQSEWQKGRISSGRKSGLAIVSLLNVPYRPLDSLLNLKEIQLGLKDITIDHESQSFDAPVLWSSIWHAQLSSIYDTKDDESHAQRMAMLSSLVSCTVESVISTLLLSAASPVIATNLLYLVAGILYHISMLISRQVLYCHLQIWT